MDTPKKARAGITRVISFSVDDDLRQSLANLPNRSRFVCDSVRVALHQKGLVESAQSAVVILPPRKKQNVQPGQLGTQAVNTPAVGTQNGAEDSNA